MDAIIDWFAARAVVFGAIACVLYIIIPEKKYRKGAKHDWLN